MKTKILKNKVTIDMSVSEYDTLFKYINKIDSMLNTVMIYGCLMFIT
jgi:hypothetical protein